MADKARRSGILFRPHFKTHQSAEVGQWFRDEGVNSITVSSAEMAVKFASDGWDDISIAFPANPREINTYNDLASGVELNLMADSTEVVRFLGANMEHDFGLFIEVDCGYGRSGVPAHHFETIESMLGHCKNPGTLNLKGFLTHAGNTYHAKSRKEIISIHDDSIAKLSVLKEKYISSFPGLIISIGDTPSCSLVEDLSGADEIRPGNFVYYDLMQYALGVCKIDDIGVSAACPVCGIYPERNEIVVYGGAVHLSKEYLQNKGKQYGLVVRYNEHGRTAAVEDTRLVSLSQEHGTIRTTTAFINTVKHGDILGILPIHSCLTANLLKDNIKII